MDAPSRIEDGGASVEDLFLDARYALEKKKYHAAADLAWRFMKATKPTDDNYESAEFILARSLDQLKYYDMAAEYYVEVIRHGAAKELIVESFQSIVNIMDRHPYDVHLIENEVIPTADFDFFPQDLFYSIKYHQGKANLLNEDKDWADDQFKKIEKNTVPSFKVAYFQAVKLLDDKKTVEAKEILSDIIKNAPRKTRVRNTAVQTLARLEYEEKLYPESLGRYEAIDSSMLLWKEVFLEKAWSTYWQNQYQRTLGYIHALSAPQYRDSFQPEKYLLLGLTLKNLCLYDDVRETIAAFRGKHSDMIEKIRKGIPMDQTPELLRASEEDVSISLQALFLRSLEKGAEKMTAMTTGAWVDSGLRDQLAKLYDLKIKEVRIELKGKAEKALEAVAEDLLHYNEQINVLEYETRMDEFRRGALAKSTPIVAPKKNYIFSKVIHWPFQQEYWFDELDHYIVQVESRCEK